MKRTTPTASSKRRLSLVEFSAASRRHQDAHPPAIARRDGRSNVRDRARVNLDRVAAGSPKQCRAVKTDPAGSSEGLGLEVATPDKAREILSVKKGGDRVAFLTTSQESMAQSPQNQDPRWTDKAEPLRWIDAEPKPSGRGENTFHPPEPNGIFDASTTISVGSSATGAGDASYIQASPG